MSTNVSIKTKMTQSPSPIGFDSAWKTETPIPDEHLSRVVSDGLVEQATFMIGSFEKQGIPKNRTLGTIIEAYLHQLDDTFYFSRLFGAFDKITDGDYTYGEVERPSYLEISPEVYECVPTEKHHHLEQYLDFLSEELNNFTLLGAEFECVRVYVEKEDSGELCFRISTNMIRKVHQALQEQKSNE